MPVIYGSIDKRKQIMFQISGGKPRNIGYIALGRMSMRKSGRYPNGCRTFDI